MVMTDCQAMVQMPADQHKCSIFSSCVSSGDLNLVGPWCTPVECHLPDDITTEIRIRKSQLKASPHVKLGSVKIPHICGRTGLCWGAGGKFKTERGVKCL